MQRWQQQFSSGRDATTPVKGSQLLNEEERQRILLDCK
jgi:hypothetical protein